MRVLIVNVPGSGHFNPMLTVARELIKRGHEVRWYTGAYYKNAIESIGATFEPMVKAHDFGGMNKDEAFPNLTGLTGLHAFIESWKTVFLDDAPKEVDDILSILERYAADVLIADETTFGAHYVYEKTGIPLAVVASTVYFYESRDTAPIGLGIPPSNTFLGHIRNAILSTVTNQILLRDLRTYIERTRRQVGLLPIKKGVVDSTAKEPDLYLLGTVPEFEYPRSDLYEQTHFVGPFFGPPTEEFIPPSWWNDLKSGRPVIHVTAGTVTTDPSQLLIPTIKALAKEDVLVVVTTGGIPLEKVVLDSLPDNLRLEKFLPHYYLLPHVDVMVTNGGYGGVQMAIATGVPMIVAGATEEKPEVANHVVYAGVGLYLKTQSPSESQIRTAVQTLLHDPKYKQRSLNLQRECQRLNGPQNAVKLIEELVQSKQSLVA